MRRLVACAGVACALVSHAPRASAQVQQAAELAFREGRDLAARGQYAQACPKFEESQRLDPAPGTLLNLADCYENLGRSATAWATFREAEALSARTDQPTRELEARRRAQALESRLTKLVIVAAAPVAGLEVTLDGKSVTALLGTAIPIDPGTYAVVATEPSREPWRKRITARRPGTLRVEVPGPEAPPEPPPVQRPAPDPGSGVTATAPRRERGMTPLLWGLAIGSAIALGTGAVLEIRAYGELDDCRNAGGCATQDELDSIHTRFVIGDVLMGAAVIGAGVTGFLYWRGHPADAGLQLGVAASPGATGLVLRGEF